MDKAAGNIGCKFAHKQFCVRDSYVNGEIKIQAEEIYALFTGFSITDLSERQISVKTLINSVLMNDLVLFLKISRLIIR